MKDVQGWKGTFDTAGVSVELDSEQLSGSCKDWVTAETYASMYDIDCCVLLITLDAPIVMLGDFYYGRKNESIPRNRNPFLISCPMNIRCRTESKDLPLIVHPMVNCRQRKRDVFCG